MKILEEIETENHISLPLLDIPMMTNEKELALIEECKRKHPEQYTPEKMAEYRELAEMPCNIFKAENVSFC